jgi:hypothetical protein
MWQLMAVLIIQRRNILCRLSRRVKLFSMAGKDKESKVSVCSSTPSTLDKNG